MIRLENIRKVFRMGSAETQALRGVSLNIWEGDFISIIGASGSGKSTILHMIGLLDKPTSGNIFVRGKDASALSDGERADFRAEVFGIVFQQYNLIPWLTAEENVMLPLLLRGKMASRQMMAERFRDLALTERMRHRPFEMSGGEQQRIAFLRAIVNDPEIILGDEPTGNLDSATGEKLLDLLIELNEKERKTLVIVTHDPHIAERADAIVTLKDGRVVPERLLHNHRKIYTE